MARPFKPIVKSGSYYPSRRWTPLVYPGGYTTANGGEKEPDPVVKTASGAIVHIRDALAGPAQNVTIAIEPVQAGTGDPSPDNVRPISGWTGANVYRTGANIWGGEKMADDVVNAVNNSARSDKGENSNGKYFSLTASNEIGVGFFSMPFKEKTQYSFIFKCAKSNNRYALNFSVKYTDGTTQTLIIPGVDDRSVVPDQVYTFAISTLPNRTVEYFAGYYNSGTTYFYYDSCGLFEGVLTADQFQPYTGTTIPISFGSAGTVYGGTLDVTTGVLTVTHAGADLAALSWSTRYSGSLNKTVSANLPSTYYGYERGSMGPPFQAEVFAVQQSVNGAAALSNPDDRDGGLYWLSNASSRETTVVYIVTGLNDTPTGLIVYELATPQTYQLTPQEVQLLAGENNIWADTGNTTLTYLADGRASDIEALGILLAGRYVNTGAADEATDAEALNILLGR